MKDERWREEQSPHEPQDATPEDREERRGGLNSKVIEEILREAQELHEKGTAEPPTSPVDELESCEPEQPAESAKSAEGEENSGEGGQDADDGWSSPLISSAQEPEPKEEPAPPGLIQMTIPVGMLQCNCTIIGDPITREALVVDPGDEIGRILELIGRHKLIVKAIVSTHAHIDHVGGLAKLHDYTGAPLLMHRDDLPLYRAMEVQAAFLGVAPPPIARIDHLLNEGDPLRWGFFEASVIHTPGHTPGSICLYMPNVGVNLTMPKPRLFSGDTLFAGSIGRTDLWGGSLGQIMDSLRGKIMELPDYTEVFPGHGPATLIGEERQSNPFLRER
jgi:hydroxyacylglutathione hydrolase